MKKILVLALALVFTLPALASASVVYNAVPDPLAPNYPSQPFQAQQTNEFGDYVHLGGTDRVLTTVTVTMSNWALASTPANVAFCLASSSNCDGTGFFWPITVNVYSNSLTSDVPNTLLGTKTVVTHIPWRPVADSTCPDTGYGAGFAWKAVDTLCYNGFASNATFDLSDLGLTLPNDVIVGFVYNTQTYGPAPTGVDGPYNSLNIAVPSGNTASTGSDDSSSEVFWNTETESYYSNPICDGNTFCRDTSWSPYGTVAMQINAVAPAPTTVTVTISKFVDGEQATAESADSSAFPMSSTWNAVNIGAGSGTYSLSPVGFNNPDPYVAVTSDMTAGADYSTYEITSGSVVGASCDGSHAYALVGYTTGDTLALAEATPKSTVAPAFTDLTADKYVIVWNQTCQDPPPPLSCPTGTTKSSLLETVTVSANAPAPTFSSNLLTSGTDYLLKAYGTAGAGDGITFDARYSFRIPTSAMWTDAVSTYESLGTSLLDLRLNGATPWGNFNHAHEYWSLVSGNGTQASFLIDDVFYPNNTGDLKVDIYSCMPDIKYVTGGGNFKSGRTVNWTFGGNVWQTGTGDPVGQFELVDHSTKTSYHFNSFSLFTVDGNKATFTASGTKQGKDKTAISGVVFTITDKGEPGKDNDTISVSNSDVFFLSEDQISGGNFQVFVQ